MKKTYKLKDSVISNIVYLFQLAMMTGTDISDLFRTMELEESEEDDSFLTIPESYSTRIEANVQKMVEEAELLQKRDAN